eukprot:6300543-Amphidinium_carterae.1
MGQKQLENRLRGCLNAKLYRSSAAAGVAQGCVGVPSPMFSRAAHFIPSATLCRMPPSFVRTIRLA